MTNSNDDANNKAKPGENSEELDEILGQIHESESPGNTSRSTEEKSKEIIKTPVGADNQPEDLEGMLEKISEKPQGKAGQKDSVFQKIINFFKKS